MMAVSAESKPMNFINLFFIFLIIFVGATGNSAQNCRIAATDCHPHL